MTLQLTLPQFQENLQPGSWVGFYDAAGKATLNTIQIDPDNGNTGFLINNSSSPQVAIETNFGSAIILFAANSVIANNWIMIRTPGANDPGTFGTVVTVNSDHTVAAPERAVIADASDTTVTATLPDAQQYAHKQVAVVKSAGDNSVSVGGTVNGVTGLTLEAVHENIVLISNGSAWYSLSPHRSFVSVNANHTVVWPERVVLVDTTPGAVTITLPSAAAYKGLDITVKQSTAANTVVVDGNGAEQIDGANTYTVTNTFAAVTILSDGSTWHILSEYLA